MRRLLIVTAVPLMVALVHASDAVAGCLPESSGTQPATVEPLGTAGANFLGCFEDVSGRTGLRIFLGTDGRLIMNFDKAFTSGPGTDFTVLTGSPMTSAGNALFEFFLAGALQTSFQSVLSPDATFQFDLPAGVVADRVIVTNIGEGDIAVDDARAAHLIAEHTATIDIKPGSFPNSIHPASEGVIAVAVLSTTTFDATMIDAASVEFGPDGAAPDRSAEPVDVNGDGRLDVVFHFKTQQTGIACGDVSASLSGRTVDGATLAGSDSIMTTGCQ